MMVDRGLGNVQGEFPIRTREKSRFDEGVIDEIAIVAVGGIQDRIRLDQSRINSSSFAEAFLSHLT